MEEIMRYLPVLIPAAIVQVSLAVFALVHVLKHDHYRFGSRIMWILIVLLFGILGPIAYFIFGRSEDREDDNG